MEVGVFMVEDSLETTGLDPMPDMVKPAKRPDPAPPGDSGGA